MTNIANDRLSKPLQRIQLDLIKSMNQETLKRLVHHPEVEGVIESFELAFRMQDEVPRLMDISDESRKTAEMSVHRGGPAGLCTDLWREPQW